MRYTLTFEDEPIGTVELPEGTRMVAGDFTPLPGYALVRAAVRDASAVLWEVGLFGSPRAASGDDAERVARVLDRAASLPLALRDDVGAAVRRPPRQDGDVRPLEP